MSCVTTVCEFAKRPQMLNGTTYPHGLLLELHKLIPRRDRPTICTLVKEIG